MSWSRAFHVPITLPDGRMLRTLRDAGEYIQELPKAEHQRPEWKIAAEMLLEAVEGKGPLMFAEIAMRKAVNAGKPANTTSQGATVAVCWGWRIHPCVFRVGRYVPSPRKMTHRRPSRAACRLI